MKSPWCRAFSRSFSDFSTISFVPSFVESLFMKRVAFASVNWVSKQLWIISSFMSSGTVLVMTALIGFSVERALLIYVDSPIVSGLHFSKTSSASSFDTNSTWTFPVVVFITWNQSFNWKMFSNRFFDFYTVSEVELSWRYQSVFRIALRNNVILWASW